MVANPPVGMPRVAPYLLYEDLAAAIEWLGKAFGLEEHLRIPGEDGRPTHAEMTLAESVFMMGHPGPEYRSPRQHGHVGVLVHVYVDDVDAHHARARAAGATILEAPTDQFYGDRRYSVEDLEGHRWTFATHVRDVPPEEMHPGVTS